MLSPPQEGESKKTLVETFSRAYAAANPEEQAALRVWKRDIVLPEKTVATSRKVAEKREASLHVTGVSSSFHFR
jgi:hypothetical protein